MNIRKTIRHIFGLDLFGVPPAPARKERSGGYRDIPARRVFPDELERLRSENRELREKLRNAVANFSREQDENGRLRTKLAHPSPTPYLERIEALRQALADIMTGNANPGALVPDAYMIRANAALQADDKARGPLPPTQHKPLDRVPSWSIDTPPSWGK